MLPPELRNQFRQAREAPNAESNELAGLKTIPEVIGFLVETARHDGFDEVDVVELVLTEVEPDRETLLADATLLRRLGYIRVSDMMRQLARIAPQRQSNLARWPARSAQ